MSFRLRQLYPLSESQASGNPEPCKQFGVVLNPFEPQNRPNWTVFIFGIAPISYLFSVTCRRYFKLEWVPLPPVAL